MDNKLIVPDLQNKYLGKLHRNATLDSTSSSLKRQKMKLYEGITPLVNITKKTSINQFLDFPVCMSLLTNGAQKKEKEEKNKPISNRKFILKDVKNFSMKNLLIQSQTETKKELILPKTKNVISRNPNGSANNLLSPIQSNIKNYLIHIKKFNFQTSRNISKPRLKKINNAKMTKFTQRNYPNIKIIKSNKLEKINKSEKNYDLDVSEIKNKKFTFGGFKTNLNNKKNEINDKLQNDKIFIEDNKNNNIDTQNKQDNNKLEKQKQNTKNKEVNVKKENVNENNNKTNSKPKNEEVKKLSPIINNKKGKLLLNKVNNNEKDMNNTKNKDKKVIIDLKPLNLQDYGTSSEDLNLMPSGKEGKNDIIIKKSKFGIILHNKRVNKVYNKSKFLNEINEELTENLINKRINSKLISQKENLLTNTENKYDDFFNKENSKIIKHSQQFLLPIEMKIFMSKYIKGIVLDKNKLKIYKETYINLFCKKIDNKFNCIICSVTRDYLFGKYESNRISLRSKKKMDEEDKNNLIKKFKQDKKIDVFKKSQTFKYNEITQNKKFNSDNFSVDKSKNVKLRLDKNLGDFIIIQEFILKSLPFYKENYIRLINFHNDYKGLSKRYANFRSFDKGMSKKFSAMANYEALSKKNSFNSLPFSGSHRRRLERRSGSILNIESIRQTLRVLQKTEPRETNFSVLKQKQFFKKYHTNNDNIIEEGEKESSKSLEKDKGEVTEGDKKLESLYFNLMKALFDGKIKVFRNLYAKNRKFIDINQILIEGNTLLILAVREGNYQITKFLCEEKADVNIQNAEGNTALHYAIGKQFYSIADILTTHGAKEDLLNIKGLSPWDCIENNVD